MNSIYIATSLDGYIATKDGGLDWLLEVPNPEESDFGFADFMDSVDAITMGRNTYEVVCSFGQWPYTKPVYVLSRTLKHVAEEHLGKVQILSGTPEDVVQRISSEGHTSLYVDGGRVIQSFLAEDLIDTLVITVVPVILGGGIPLFGELPNPLNLAHVKTEVFENGLVKSTYSRER